MKLHGIHHVTAITGDPDRCIEFYAGLLGLARLPDARGVSGRVLRFGDELGRPGSTLCFIDQSGAPAGRPGAGMVHRIRWRVADVEVLNFWSRRLATAGVKPTYEDPRAGEMVLRFSDSEGLEHELVPVGPERMALVARSADLSPHRALRGFDGVHAYCREPVPTADVLAGRLGFDTLHESAFGVAGPRRRAHYVLDRPPRERGVPGPGTVDHVAWWGRRHHQSVWRQRVIGLGIRVSPVTRRGPLESIFFREPSGVLFEIAA
ncbi:MAG: VOC family protein [Solirubrobacterales bacterium]